MAAVISLLKLHLVPIKELEHAGELRRRSSTTRKNVTESVEDGMFTRTNLQTQHNKMPPLTPYPIRKRISLVRIGLPGGGMVYIIDTPRCFSAKAEEQVHEAVLSDTHI